MASQMIPLDLREYGEMQRAAGNDWGDAIIDAADAQEQIDWCETLDDEIRTVLEETGCERGEYETLSAVRKVCGENEALHAWIERQDDKWWLEDDTSLSRRIESGVAQLEVIRNAYEAIEECLTELGVLDGSGDEDIPAMLRLLIGG